MTSSPYISLICHSKMELTDVAFCFQKFHWLLENNETDQVDCLTAFGYFKRNEQLSIWMTVVDCQFLVFDNWF